MPDRLPRVNQLIRQELSEIIRRESESLNGLLITLTRVDTSPNLIQSKVYLSIMPESQAARTLQSLNRNIYRMQQKLNKRLKMRPVPKIILLEEKQTARAGQIEKILARLKK